MPAQTSLHGMEGMEISVEGTSSGRNAQTIYNYVNCFPPLPYVYR